MDISAIKTRLEGLLQAGEKSPTVELQSELYHGALAIMSMMYGPNSSQERGLQAHIEYNREKLHPGSSAVKEFSIKAIRGALSSMKSEVDAGLIGSLRATLSGEVLVDLVKLARTTLAESGDDAKNVAAVLAAAAFEDTIRKLADLKGIVQTEKLADVLIALKTAGVFQGAQVGIAQSYLTFRNKALHAKWPEVDRTAVQSVLAFTEQLILEYFR